MVPQLDTSFYTSQLFWLIVSLSILLYAFKKIFIPKINNLINQRSDYIKSLKTEITNLEQQIASLSEKLDGIKKAKITEENKIIDQAREQCNLELKQQLEELNKENEANLKKIQQESINSINNLEKSMNSQIEELSSALFKKLFPEGR